MPRTNLKLVSPSPPAPALGKLEAALENAKTQLAQAEAVLRDVERRWVPTWTPADPNDPAREEHRQAFDARERAYGEVRRAEQAIKDHHIAAGRAAGESERRERLADAIEAARKADAALASARKALERAEEMADRAEHAIAAGAAAVAKAKETHARQAERAARSGKQPVESGALREARALEQKAMDELEAARAAATRIEATIPDLEDDAKKATETVSAAIGNLLAIQVPQLLERARRQQRELGTIRALLRQLKSANLIDADTKLIADFFYEPPFPHERNNSGTPPAKHPDVGAWDAAIEALARDANAPLPTLTDAI